VATLKTAPPVEGNDPGALTAESVAISCALSAKDAAARLSANCSGLRASRTTEVTAGCATTQASATCARLTPRALAILPTASMIA
jgi:hypothetical protein